MAKTKEELDTLRIEYETLNNKLNELTDDELKIVAGGKSVPNNQEAGPKYSNGSNVRFYLWNDGLEVNGTIQKSHWDNENNQYAYDIWHDTVRTIRGWQVDYINACVEENILEENIKYSI